MHVGDVRPNQNSEKNGKSGRLFATNGIFSHLQLLDSNVTGSAYIRPRSVPRTANSAIAIRPENLFLRNVGVAHIEDKL